MIGHALDAALVTVLAISIAWGLYEIAKRRRPKRDRSRLAESDLDRVALTFGIVRFPDESDAELRTRMMSFVHTFSSPRMLTRELARTMPDKSLHELRPWNVSPESWDRIIAERRATKG